MKYPDDFINKIICGNHLNVIQYISDNTIHLTLTSPPYDDLRNYEGYTFDYKKMIKKIPTLFNKKGFKIFKWYLATRGIKKIEYIKVKNKIYGMFEVDKKEKIE